MPEPSRRILDLLKSPDLRLLTFTAIGLAAFGVVDGTLWRYLPSPTLGYRHAITIAVTLLFGWRGLLWSQLLYLAVFSYYFGWRGAVIVEPPYLLSHACALVVARGLAEKQTWLSRERSTLAFLAGAILAPAIPAFLNDPMLRLLGATIRPGVPAAISSWLRECAGILAVAPAVLVCASGRLKEWVGFPAEREWQPITVRDVLELGLEVAAWTATLWMTVHFRARYGLNVTYLTFLPPLALTLHRGMRLAAPALALNAVAATTLWSLLHWGDALSAGDLRLLIAIYSLTILVLAAVVDEAQRARMEIVTRTRAEAALRESEERFRTMADSAPVMIWVSGPDKLCTFVNQPCVNFTGRTLDQHLGRGWVNGLHPDDVERYVAAYYSSFDARAQFRMECRFRRADGEYRWVLVIGVPLHREGEFAGYIGSCVDVTEQKLAAQRVQASEARLKYAQKLAKVGSWERHMETGSYDWSEEKLRIFGVDSAAALDVAGFLAFVDANDRPKVQECSDRACLSSAPVEVEYRINRADGETRIVRTIIEAIRNNKGDVVRLVGATQDVTDVKRAQEGAFTRQKLEILGTLANGIAHDFNNVLGGVVAQAELALTEWADGSSPEDTLKAISAVALRGSEIVRELMIYAGTESEHLSPIDVSQIVENMLGLLEVSISKHASIQAQLDSHLPPILANPARISQVVMNLVANSSDAIGNRDGVIRVTTHQVTAGPPEDPEAGQSREYVQLMVSDTGSGIPREMQSRVFDPFFSTKSAGRGVGLAVVQGIVRSLGGAIRLASEPGQGTTVIILLPCVETLSEPKDAPAVDGVAPAWLSRSIFVLLVEDEDPLRQAVSKILNRTGLSVMEARDGSVALEVIREQQRRIDVMLLDITIPGATSREVLSEARRLRPELKVIVTSAYTEEVAAESLYAKVEHFLRKPYRLNDLVKIIQKALA